MNMINYDLFHFTKHKQTNKLSFSPSVGAITLEAKVKVNLFPLLVLPFPSHSPPKFPVPKSPQVKEPQRISKCFEKTPSSLLNPFPTLNYNGQSNERREGRKKKGVSKNHQLVRFIIPAYL